MTDLQTLIYWFRLYRASTGWTRNLLRAAFLRSAMSYRMGRPDHDPLLGM